MSSFTDFISNVFSFSKKQRAEPLQKLMESNTAILFGEAHDDSKLIEKYKAIFQAANQAGVKHACLERPPKVETIISQQNEEINNYINILSELGYDTNKINTDLLDTLETDKTISKFEAITFLAKVYDIQLHCVDITDRGQLDIYENALNGYKDHLKTNPEGNHTSYLESLTEIQLQKFAKMLGKETITAKEINQIVISLASKRDLDSALKNRIIGGDKLIANEIISRVGGEQFIYIGGKAHIGLHNDNEAYQEVNLKGALDLIYGKSGGVVAIDITPEVEPCKNPTIHRLNTKNYSQILVNIPETKITLSEEVRLAALNKHELPDMQGH